MAIAGDASTVDMPEVMYRISDRTLLQLVTKAAEIAESGKDPRSNPLYRYAMLEAERRINARR